MGICASAPVDSEQLTGHDTQPKPKAEATQPVENAKVSNSQEDRTNNQPNAPTPVAQDSKLSTEMGTLTTQLSPTKPVRLPPHLKQPQQQQEVVTQKEASQSTEEQVQDEQNQHNFHENDQKSHQDEKSQNDPLSQQHPHFDQNDQPSPSASTSPSTLTTSSHISTTAIAVPSSPPPPPHQSRQSQPPQPSASPQQPLNAPKTPQVPNNNNSSTKSNDSSHSNPPAREDSHKTTVKSTPTPSVNESHSENSPPTPMLKDKHMFSKFKDKFSKKTDHETLRRQTIVHDGILFGRPLQALVDDEMCDDSGVPYFLIIIGQYLLQNDEVCETEGIFRVTGNNLHMTQLRQCLDFNHSLRPQDWDIHVLLNTVKVFLRELPEPLIPPQLFVPLIEAYQSGDEPLVFALLNSLDRCPKSILKYILRLGVHCTAPRFKKYNLISTQSYCVIFAPNIVRQRQGKLSQDIHQVQSDMSAAVAILMLLMESVRSELTDSTTDTSFLSHSDTASNSQSHSTMGGRVSHQPVTVATTGMVLADLSLDEIPDIDRRYLDHHALEPPKALGDSDFHLAQGGTRESYQRRPTIVHPCSNTTPIVSDEPISIITQSDPLGDLEIIKTGLEQAGLMAAPQRRNTVIREENHLVDVDRNIEIYSISSPSHPLPPHTSTSPILASQAQGRQRGGAEVGDCVLPPPIPTGKAIQVTNMRSALDTVPEFQRQKLQSTPLPILPIPVESRPLPPRPDQVQNLQLVQIEQHRRSSVIERDHSVPPAASATSPLYPKPHQGSQPPPVQRQSSQGPVGHGNNGHVNEPNPISPSSPQPPAVNTFYALPRRASVGRTGSTEPNMRGINPRRSISQAPSHLKFNHDSPNDHSGLQSTSITSLGPLGGIGAGAVPQGAPNAAPVNQFGSTGAGFALSRKVSGKKYYIPTRQGPLATSSTSSFVAGAVMEQSMGISPISPQPLGLQLPPTPRNNQNGSNGTNQTTPGGRSIQSIRNRGGGGRVMVQQPSTPKSQSQNSQNSHSLQNNNNNTGSHNNAPNLLATSSFDTNSNANMTVTPSTPTSSLMQNHHGSTFTPGSEGILASQNDQNNAQNSQKGQIGSNSLGNAPFGTLTPISSPTTPSHTIEFVALKDVNTPSISGLSRTDMELEQGIHDVDHNDERLDEISSPPEIANLIAITDTIRPDSMFRPVSIRQSVSYDENNRVISANVCDMPLVVNNNSKNDNNANINHNDPLSQHPFVKIPEDDEPALLPLSRNASMTPTGGMEFQNDKTAAIIAQSTGVDVEVIRSRGISFAPPTDPEQLFAGWQAFTDIDGSLYYHHAASNTIRYIRPCWNNRQKIKLDP